MNYLHARFPFIACESYADFEQNIRIIKHLHRLIPNIIFSKIDTERVNVTIYLDST